MGGAVINPETGRGFAFEDRTGTRNGRLVYQEYIGRDKNKKSVWRALCDCGTEAIVSSKKVKSCGCLRREVAAMTQRAKALPPDVKRKNRLASAAKQRAKRRKNPISVMHSRISRLHRHALNRIGGIKTSPTLEALGYTAEELVSHIERQFVPGMGWHNMDKWQIDHIVPSSRAETEDDVVALNQLPNLRPMWAKENNAKKAKMVSLL